MDWNLKTPNWDFSEYEQGNIQNIDGVSGSSSYKGDFSVDLKLGHEVFESGNEFEESLKETNVSKMWLSSSSSPSGSTKRARAIGNGVQTPSCLVDGCNVDLSNCREYHRRHKVCEVHSKTAEVTINGNKQRFCQQCSRFHSPEEFDEGKRSCRKRLDGHNRRRRKSQPDTMSRSGSLFSTNQGPTMLQFSNPQVYPTTAITNPIWAGLIKPEEDIKFYNNRHTQSHLPESSSSSNKGSSVNQFNLFHSTNLELNNNNNNNNNHNSRRASSTCQPLLQTITSSETSSNNSSDKMLLCDGFPSRDCALSLLSSSSTQTTSCIGGPRLVMPSGPTLIPTGHPLGASAAAYGGMEPMESILVHNGGGGEGMFHMAPHASSRDNETPQTLPFYWE